jgi:LytS/YehU family sensor histidine kinase
VTERRYLLGAALGCSLLAILLLLLGFPGARPAAIGLLCVQGLVAAYLLFRRQDEEQVPEEVLESVSSFDTTLRIGDETMPYLRQGLNFESAQRICEIILKITEVDAVAITDDEKILGFAGVGCRRHQQGGPILTGATRDVLDNGHTMIVSDPKILSCDEQGCPHPLKAAVITPLIYRGKVVGTFKLYRSSPKPLPSYVVRLAVGIAALMGIQMEAAEADRQRQLVTKARLEALQAQIRPHFLFNVLNTIIMFSRTDPEKSRELLVMLAQFFRRSLSHRGEMITLQDEIDYINTYLALEKARFGEKLQVKMKLDPRALPVQIPLLTVQPLVENAVVHGLAPKEEGGTIGLRVRRTRGHLVICIADDGVGIQPERLRRVLEDGYGSNMGIGLTNVNDRLISLYGEAYRLRIRSIPGRGTAIRIRIPLETGLAASMSRKGEQEVRTAAW